MLPATNLLYIDYQDNEFTILFLNIKKDPGYSPESEN